MKIFLILILTSMLFIGCRKDTEQQIGYSEKYTKLVWHDEFDGTGLPDSLKWSYESGYCRNNELQYYTVARRENVRQESGNLVITALNDSLFIDGRIHPISSASIHTRYKGDWKYGRVEVRAKLPSCLGSWPAIWMMPTNSVFGSWPDSGEIDIMEHVGYDPNRVFFSVHTQQYNHRKGNGRGSNVIHSNTDKEFNIYAIEWFEDRIDWFFNNTKVFTFEKNEESWEAWPFDNEFYLILNLAFGGSWGGANGIDTKALPIHYYIDYVRVYQ